MANRSLGLSRDARDSRGRAVLPLVLGAVILAQTINDLEFASRMLGSAKRFCYRPRIALERCAEGRRATTYF